MNAHVLMYGLLLGIYYVCKMDSPVQGTDQSWTKPPFPNVLSNVSQFSPGGLSQGYAVQAN